jgi:hypothetical protein
MSVDVPTAASYGVVNFATGQLDPTANEAITVTVGFTPRHIILVNEDLVVRWEKFAGMAAAAAWKTVTAGTSTYDANSGIVINTDGTFTISAAAAGDGDNVMWAAWG